MRFLLLSVFLLSGSALAADYTHCNIQSMPFLVPAYKIGAKGELTVPPQDKRVVSFKKGKSEDVLVARDFWPVEGAKGIQPDYKSKVVLKKEGGRPVSITQEYDKEMIAASRKVMPAQWRDFPMVKSTKNKFAYADNKCFVSESSVQYSNGVDAVIYDHELCNNLLGAAKKATMKKLAACKQTFAQMNDIIREFQQKTKDSGRDFSYGFIGTPKMTNPKEIAGMREDTDWTTMLMLSHCNMVRATYGMPIDPDTAMVNFSSGAFAPPISAPDALPDEVKKTTPAN